MTEPRQPADHPAPEETKPIPPDNPTGRTPNGVPPEAAADEAKAYPTSDRQNTETAAKPDKPAV